MNYPNVPTAGQGPGGREILMSQRRTQAGRGVTGECDATHEARFTC
jgi:hypothetical protein